MEEKTDVYFLDNNCELKLVLTTIPHEQIFIKNDNGKLIVLTYEEKRRETFKRKKLVNK